MFNVGDRVIGPRGAGVVVRHRVPQARIDYLFSARGSEVLSTLPPVMIPLAVDAVYSADRYPFVVRFDDGYEDVYGPHELQLIVESGTHVLGCS